MDTCSPERWNEEEEKIKEEMLKYETSSCAFLWIVSTCPDCGAANWIEMDPKMDACLCFRCQKTFWVSEAAYDNYKVEIIMSKVFDYDARVPEWVFKGMKNPD